MISGLHAIRAYFAWKTPVAQAPAWEECNRNQALHLDLTLHCKNRQAEAIPWIQTYEIPGYTSCEVD